MTQYASTCPSDAIRRVCASHILLAQTPSHRAHTHTALTYSFLLLSSLHYTSAHAAQHRIASTRPIHYPHEAVAGWTLISLLARAVDTLFDLFSLYSLVHHRQ